jgi:hypothetical protein
VAREEKEILKLTKEVESIHQLLLLPVEGGDTIEVEGRRQHFERLQTKLQSKLMTALEFVMDDLKVAPLRSGSVHPLAAKITWHKKDLACGLVEWVGLIRQSSLFSIDQADQRKTKPDRSSDPPPVRTSTLEALTHIRKVIRDMEVPSWVYAVPLGFGEAKTGTLKADEWRTLTTIYLPVALTTIWGEGSEHKTTHVASALRARLDHTMHLTSAITLACYRHITEKQIESYKEHMVTYLETLQDFYPHARRLCNQHMSLHLPMFMRSFGPVYSWWAFVYERLIGRLQCLPSNNKFGEFAHNSGRNLTLFTVCYR